VYVSSAANLTSGHIYEFSAATNGALTAIPGSPVPTNGVNYMALTGTWLFGVANQDTDIDSFFIGFNGALRRRDIYHVTPRGPGVISVYLDHTGSTLYGDFYTTNNDYLSFSINQTTGQLKETGDLPGGPPNNSPVSFIGNNKYAYSSSCYHFGPEIIGVERNTDGTLAYLNNFSSPFQRRNPADSIALYGPPPIQRIIWRLPWSRLIRTEVRMGLGNWLLIRSIAPEI